MGEKDFNQKRGQGTSLSLQGLLWLQELVIGVMNMEAEVSKRSRRGQDSWKARLGDFMCFCKYLTAFITFLSLGFCANVSARSQSPAYMEREHHGGGSGQEAFRVLAQPHPVVTRTQAPKRGWNSPESPRVAAAVLGPQALSSVIPQTLPGSQGCTALLPPQTLCIHVTLGMGGARGRGSGLRPRLQRQPCGR